MFLWTRPFTTNVLLGLITSNAPWPTLREWNIELGIAVFVVLPLAVLAGQLYIRVAAALSVKPFAKLVRQSIPPAAYTTMCQVIMADVIVACLVSSVAHRVDGISLEHDDYTTTTTTTNTMWSWNSEWGYSGPFCIFTVRLLFALVGVTIGEAFFPLALTGGIACGKSTFSKLLAERHGFVMIDADKIGHLILLPPWHVDLQSLSADNNLWVTPKDSVYVQILEIFGHENTTHTDNHGVNEHHPLLDDDKNIDRAKLGARIFANPSDRQKLNAITHPCIFYCLLKTIVRQIYMAGNSTSTNIQYNVCAEIPLLFESAAVMRHLFGLSLCVACTPTQQYQRLVARNPETPKEECQKRIDSQMPITTKVQLADIVLWNDKDLKTENNTKKNDDAKDKDNDMINPQIQEAQKQQVDKAVRIIKARTKGIMETTLTQILLFLSGSLVISASFKLYSGNYS